MNPTTRWTTTLQKSTCPKQLTLGPYAVQIWSRAPSGAASSRSRYRFPASQFSPRETSPTLRLSPILTKVPLWLEDVPLSTLDARVELHRGGSHGFPHGGLRPLHQKSTCLKQLTLGPYAVQIWSLTQRFTYSDDWSPKPCILNPEP